MTDPRPPQINRFKTLDKDLDRQSVFEHAADAVSRPIVALGIAALFIGICALIAAAFAGEGQTMLIITAAAGFGAYMALNIGANDVANNMGPAVGSKALTMGGALIIAAVCETAGALIAGGDVVSTIAGGIVAPEAVATESVFVRAMLAALIASSLWLNIATWAGAPVSTTHSIVGGVVGAGIVAGGFAAVNWGMIGQIAASWVISPVLGGIFAALFLAIIKARVNDVPDKLAAARIWVPALVGLMAGTFTTYLATKGLKKLIDISGLTAAGLGLAVGLLVWAWMRPVIARKSATMENRKRSLKQLFGLPLVAAAALMSFAHGANDVSNAVGPLAAIVHVVQGNGMAAGSVGLPLWILAIGAFGISFGLMLFGPKLIRLVGDQITKLNQIRAFCVALSAAITVIFASALGLPVSSTHIAVGGIFGVGFYREWEAERRARRQNLHKGTPLSAEERRRRKLVRRHHVVGIAAAWVITVPATALISALVFWLLGTLI
ncbi:inorganic phosphate transporter [Pseudogemmobacter faecipullorum]|uniref:Phosphate transporter n=1 Tax=Pseudogemmobacter faecipullorum TaxID=2755041 RepID=A0ABS8CNR4_9RHOB|nr:inorganic phosphate transporter [Pseudogemmobacter faecipullorum]MCB5411046.1 inorganic phosphate transporter [Pseudogemmobacter faecipullorum]